MTGYEAFPSLGFDQPEEGILRITLDAPGLNAVSPAMHRDLADVWLTIDRDDAVRVVVLQGAGKAFSAGGSFDLIDSLMNDRDSRLRVAIEMSARSAATSPAPTAGPWMADTTGFEQLMTL